jgi:hypothetical protein
MITSDILANVQFPTPKKQNSAGRLLTLLKNRDEKSYQQFAMSIGFGGPKNKVLANAGAALIFTSTLELYEQFKADMGSLNSDNEEEMKTLLTGLASLPAHINADNLAAGTSQGDCAMMGNLQD